MIARVLLLVGALLPAALHAQTIPGALPESATALSQGQWPAYAGTNAAARYSPLTQINRDNAKNLHVVWRWKSPDAAIRGAKPEIGPGYVNESTPLMVDGVLYTSTSLSQVAAIDAATGETKWVFDPKVYENGLGPPANNGWTHRGVAYWRKGDDERIVILTAFAQMIALDAKTGKPVPDFGTDGRVDLNLGMRRPVFAAFLHHDLAAGDRARRHRGRLLRAGLVGRAAVAGRRRQRLRYRQRKAALDFPHGGAGRGARRGDLEERFLEGGGQRQCLGADERRRRARLRLSAGEHADQRLLRRPPAAATVSMARAWSVSMSPRARRSGTISSCITAFGTTTRRPRRT